jgi:hypothetical protein
MGDGQRHHVTATRHCIAASTGIPESEWSAIGEITLIPRDEYDGVPVPGAGAHNSVDGIAKEGIAGSDE